jgi:outer membrane receptor protein involved in Fe transport
MEDDAAAYAQIIVTPIAPLSITGSVRADYVHIPFRDRLDADNDGTSSYDQLSPEIGVTYRFTDDLKAYVGYKSGFRAPAPLELACASPDAPCSLPSALGADPALRPVVSRDFEGGLDLDVPKVRTSLDLDGFWTDVTNDIVFASPNLTQGYFLNVPKTRRAGVEASVETRLPAGFRIFGSYSYVAATFQSTIQIATADTNPQPARPGDLFPSSPLHHGRAGIAYGHQIGHGFLFDGTFDVIGVSGQYLRGDESNHYPEIPGYAVDGLHARLTWTRYAAQLDVDNLFDRRYAAFGIIAQNQFGSTVGSTTIVANPETVPFLTPGYARRITVALDVRL